MTDRHDQTHYPFQYAPGNKSNYLIIPVSEMLLGSHFLDQLVLSPDQIYRAALSKNRVWTLTKKTGYIIYIRRIYLIEIKPKNKPQGSPVKSTVLWNTVLLDLQCD